jgi:CubicO group peptidase (beta-lactamase class C family)
MRNKISRSELEELVQKTLNLWHVPGLAIAVVQDGQVRLCEGFGLRNVAQALPVTSQTLFPIASCTKAFTAMTVGMLVDDGLLEWDKPIKKYLPDFKMRDDYATKCLTPRDLLSHRCGLPGHDMMWYATKFNRREIMKRLRYLEPTCDLRTTFQYQNLMYVVIGVLIEEVSGISWEQFVRTRILNPLAMDRSNFSTVITQQDSDFASPYLYRHGHFKEIPFFVDDGENSGLCPAGGICSCVKELANWVQVLLNKAKIGDVVLVSEENLNQMYTPHIFTEDSNARKQYGYEFTSYGLGWGMRSHKGEFLLEHDGMTDGFYSLVSMMPRHKIGIVALSNGDAYWGAPQANLVPNIISYMIYDRLLDRKVTDWNGLMRSANDEMAEMIRKMQEQSPHGAKIIEPAEFPLEAFLGNYEHPAYGIASVRMDADHLQMVINDTLFLPMRHSNANTFEVYFDLADQWQKIAFRCDASGRISQLSCLMDPRVKEAVFNRIGL